MRTVKSRIAETARLTRFDVHGVTEYSTFEISPGLLASGLATIHSAPNTPAALTAGNRTRDYLFACGETVSPK